MELDEKYLNWKHARQQVIGSLKYLLRATHELSYAIGEARADLRISFLSWCQKHCQAFDIRIARAVESVAHRTHVSGQIETWQLRLLGVVTVVHHSERPQAARRRNKQISWLSFISRTHEEVGKLFERVGGVQNMPAEQRSAIARQLGSFDTIRAKLGREFRG